MTLLDESTLQRVFGGLIDEATLRIDEQREVYDATIASKYGEPIASVLGRLRPSERPLGALQLQIEMNQIRERQIKDLAATSAAASKRAKTAEDELKDVARFRKRMKLRQQEVRRRKRRGR